MHSRGTARAIHRLASARRSRRRAVERADKRTPRRAEPDGAFTDKAGDGLLSHHLSMAVPSALQGLTAVFGMGTGVAPAR